MAVRREKVVLTLEDHFTTEMARAAAATQTLDKSLKRLSTTSVGTARGVRDTSTETDRLGLSLRRGGAELDRFSGRLRLMLDAAAILGPSLAPIGGLGIAAVSGLASQLGVAAVGMTSLVVASQGVGDALEAVNEASLDPTVANLAKAEDAMSRLGPAAQVFVTRFQQLRPVLADIRDAAAAGWFPGLADALDSVEKVGPEVARLFERIGSVGGDLVAEGASALAGPEWADFRAFIAQTAPRALDELGRTIGNLAKGMAELWEAFGPLNQDFSTWLLDASRGFAQWADGLSRTDGFVEFVDYIRDNGPKVADAAQAIANAVVEIVEAAAPLGGPVLETLAALADAVAAIADSPLGTPIMTAVTAMSALSLASRGVSAGLAGVNTQLAAVGAQGPRTAAALGMVHKAALGLVGLEIGTSILDGIRDSAVGAAPSVDRLATSLESLDASSLKAELGGSLSDLLKANTDQMNGFSAGIKDLADKTGWFGDAAGIFVPSLKYMGIETEQAKQAATSLDDALVQMIATAGADQTRAAFDELARSENLSASAKKDLIALLPGYQAALDSTGVAARRAAVPTDALTASVQRLKTAYTNITAVLTKQGAWDAYQASIDTLTESIKRNGKTLDANTEKGRENRANLNSIAESAVQFAEHLDEADRADFLRNAIKSFREGAEQAGGLDRRAREVLNALKALLRVNPNPKITVDDKASPKLRAIIEQINAVRDKNVTIATTWKNFYTGDPGKPKTKKSPNPTADPWRAPLERATGGLVLGPGGPRDDLIPALLSNREYVISAAAVHEYGIDFLDALNSRRLQRSRDDYALASGGAIGNWMEHVEKNQEIAA